ncbi:protein kinase [Streptomyces sp. NPDC096339]|uniref:protein kinase domain-containing protein n=1 Tax=Streptomyces sp. NPDC096339 TaxID=3366086 RepID=UPI0037FBC3B3
MRVGDQLAGRYRLDRRLGAGGMGEVWHGHDLNLDRSVAVKTLLEAASGDEFVARFRREATIGARLQHPGITVVHDVGQQDDRLFIVMELLAGEDLGTVLAREPRGLPVDAALGLAAQTAEALAAAHEQGVVHRDLKPANLFLLPDGRLKICDFGIAYSPDATAGWTVTGWAFGTIPYMAPEQCLGRHVDARCDLYALGCVLYALLSGEPPFGVTETAYVLMRRHVEDPPPALPVAPEVDRLVRALLAKAPEDRPESAAVVAKALRGLIGAGGAAPEYVPAEVDADPPDPRAHPVGEDFVRELLREAAELVRSAPGSAPLRVEALALAADAAARFDAGLAGRLLAEAERCAWTDGGADGARVAELLTVLARHTSEHAPARTLRILTDAQQALFTVFGPDREKALRGVVAELARIAPERSALLTPGLFAGQTAGDRVWARIAVATARADPGRAMVYLPEIGDAGLRAVTESDIVGVIASSDPATGLRMAGRIQNPTARALAMFRSASARKEGVDWESLEEAENAVARAARQRAAGLRERAGELADEGRVVQAGQLRDQAERLASVDFVTSGYPEIDAAMTALSEARRLATQGPAPALDPAVARERAAAARSAHAEGPERAIELARIARLSAADELSPWHPEPAADPGTPPDHLQPAAPGVGAPARPNPRLAGLSGVPRWSTAAKPAALCRAGDAVAWLAGDEVGAVRADSGAVRWTADSDAGVPVPPPDGRTTSALAVDGEGGGVFVAVEGWDRPGVRLLARDPLNGQVRWWRDLPEEATVKRGAGPDAPAQFSVAGGLVVYGGLKAVTALSAATGEEVWSCPGSYGASLTLTAGPDCLVLAQRARLTGLHLQSGATLWSGPPGKEPTVEPAGPDVPVGPVHVVSGGFVRSLHQRTGRQFWAVEVGEPAPGLLVRGGVVFAAGSDPKLPGSAVFAIEAETGRTIWKSQVTRRHQSGECALQLLGVRAGLLYVKCALPGPALRRGTKDPFLVALDPDTGQSRWRWENPGIGSRGAVLHGDSVVLPLPALTAVALP